MSAFTNSDTENALEAALPESSSLSPETARSSSQQPAFTESALEKVLESSPSPPSHSINDKGTKDTNADIEKEADLSGGGVVAETPSNDPNVVDFDPDDPEKGLNWPSRKKWTVIWLLSILTLITSVFGPDS